MGNTIGTTSTTNLETFEPISILSKKIDYAVCCITFNGVDILRLLACPPELIPLIREVIEQSWGDIQSEGPYNDAYEFKLTGYPWIGWGSSGVASRRLLVDVLTVMARNGWTLLQSVDASASKLDTSLFFERGKADADASLFAVSFNDHDIIRIIDKPEFLPELKDAVAAFWPSGISSEREYYGSMELKLGGYPWLNYELFSVATVNSRLVLAQIIVNLRSMGYKLYASVEICLGYNGRDLNSWVFRKVGPNWK